MMYSNIFCLDYSNLVNLRNHICTAGPLVCFIKDEIIAFLGFFVVHTFFHANDSAEQVLG